MTKKIKIVAKTKRDTCLSSKRTTGMPKSKGTKVHKIDKKNI
jgi:hypothetical protein